MLLHVARSLKSHIPTRARIASQKSKRLFDNCLHLPHLQKSSSFRKNRTTQIQTPISQVFSPYCRPIHTSKAITNVPSSQEQQPSKSFKFEILHKSIKSHARVGRVTTTHGSYLTPTFVPVATNGVIKAGDNKQIAQECHTNLMFCNTYHLLCHPGSELIRDAGGIHQFINYPHPIITDSGGFQIFSLMDRPSPSQELKGNMPQKNAGTVLKISEDGVTFRNYRNGDIIFVSPETTIAAQKNFGSDIMIPLDELPSHHISREELKKSLHKTHRWENRSLQFHLQNPSDQAIFSVIHGGTDLELRRESLEFLLNLNGFDGHCIGGSVGKDRAEMFDFLKKFAGAVPEQFPVHLLGIGDTESLDFAVPFGIDSFDSAYPTRIGRHGNLLVFNPDGVTQRLMPIKHESMRNKFHEKIDPTCDCYTCSNHSVAFLHHLFKTNELSFQILGSLHNVHSMMKKMQRMQQLIFENKI